MNQPSDKVIAINDYIKGDNRDGTLVVCYGHFNVIHPGHLRYLKHARSLGDSLVIALLDDKYFLGDSHFYPENDRAEGVSLLNFVDNVVILNDGGIDQLVQIVKPDILVLGNEYQDRRDEQIELAVSLLKNQGGQVVYHAGQTQYASADLLNYGVDDLEKEKILVFKKACSSQSIKLEDVKKRLNELEKINLLVIGDTIVDQYVACDALGMSAEAPVLVVREIESREFLGGAAIVASHIRSLGSGCHFLSVVGDDLHASYVKEKLIKNGIKPHLICDPSRPTTYKIRYMVENQKLFRVSRLKEHKLSVQLEEEVIKKIYDIAADIDSILISDFVYGVITEKVLNAVRDVASMYNLKIFGDLQCSSQMGKITKFRGFDLISPTEREARIGMENSTDGLEQIATSLMEEVNLNDLVITLGSDGFVTYSKQKDGFFKRQHYPALTVNPIDVAGAGDSMFSVISACISSGGNAMEASAIGACMASLAVREIGNNVISKERLMSYMLKILA